MGREPAFKSCRIGVFDIRAEFVGGKAACDEKRVDVFADRTLHIGSDTIPDGKDSALVR